MAYTSEIDKLERRHRENPEGRTFAPLADAYRKAGDVPRALEILKAGLQIHPDYLSASIVLGRCHLDLGDLPGAEAAFRRVLELDKENVIAIKALADITERQTRFGESEDWLNYLLSIDGSNEDARLQLTRLSIIREQHDKMTTLDLSPATPEKTREVVAFQPDEEEPEEEAAEAPDEEPREAPRFVEPITAKTPAIHIDLDVTVEIPPQPMAPVEEPAVEEPAVEPMGVTSSLDEVFAMAEQHEDAPPPAEDEAPVRSADADLLLPTESGAEEGFVVGVEKHEEIVLRPSSTSEYQVPSDSDLLGGRTSGGFAPRFEEDMPAAMAPSEPEPEPADEAAATGALWQSHPEDGATEDQSEAEPGAAAPAAWWSQPAAAPEPEPEPVQAAAPEPEPVPAPVAAIPEARAPVATVTAEADTELMVTETMGDVYAAQGHHVEALEVYRHLLVRSPDDERLKDKVSRLERRRSASAPSKRGFAAAETGGQSVSAYFGDLLSARLGESGNGTATVPPVADEAMSEAETADASGTMDEAFTEADAPVGGEPTRPASEPLSLSAIFGEDSSPVPPVVAGPDTQPAAERKPGSSFDEFFGERPAPPAGGTRVRTIRHSDSDQDDLDQFHKWLKGLKR